MTWKWLFPVFRRLFWPFPVFRHLFRAFPPFRHISYTPSFKTWYQNHMAWWKIEWYRLSELFANFDKKVFFSRCRQGHWTINVCFYALEKISCYLSPYIALSDIEWCYSDLFSVFVISIFSCNFCSTTLDHKSHNYKYQYLVKYLGKPTMSPDKRDETVIIK